MDSEINGINVSENVKELYKDKSKAECEELAVTVSVEIAKRIAPYVDGYYLMTPFQRAALMVKIIDQIK